MNLIVWSGGADFTNILLDRVKEGIEFETLYIHLPNNYNKTIQELRRRKYIKNKIRLKYGVEFRDHYIEIPEIDLPENSVVKLPQPMLWIQALILFFNTKTIYDSVEFGYIKGDCFGM